MSQRETHHANLSLEQTLQALTLQSKRAPVHAFLRAIDLREAITPHLLRAIDDVTSDPARFVDQARYALHIHAMYLLAQFREKRAYRSIVRMVEHPGSTPSDLLGDALPECLAPVLCSVYDGDPEPLMRMIENDTLDECVRATALNTIPLLVRSEQMSREEASTYFRALFQGRLERESNHAWVALAMAVADCQMPELMDHVRNAFADGLIWTYAVGLDDIEMLVSYPLHLHRRPTIVTDAISLLVPSWQPPSPKKQSSSKQPSAPKPVAGPRPRKPRPNDPCPCRSGKNYKNCCGPVG